MARPVSDPDWSLVRRRGIDREVDFLIDLWSVAHTPHTTARVGDLMRRFATRLRAQDRHSLLDASLEDCAAFVWAPTRRARPPSLHTVHLRRTALHGLYQTLGTLDPSTPNPAALLILPARPVNAARPLRDSEMALVRTAALGRGRESSRACAALALAEATATTGEIALARWGDLDLTRGSVSLPGAPPVRAREAHISDWGAATLARMSRRGLAAPDSWVVSRHGDYHDVHSAQAAMANLLTRVLCAAGLDDEHVRPTSIRLWAARRTLGRDGVVAAARALGIASLDATTRSLSMEEDGD